MPTGVDASFLHESSEFFDHYPGGREKGAAGKRLSDDYAREIIHANFAATSYADAQVGKVLTRLKALKLDQNTIVIVWGDHGWHLGDHTIWGKHSAFDRALNSTLLIKTPGMAQPGQSTAGLAATVDLYPTLCELTGTTPPPGLEGTSLLPLLRDPTQPGKAAVHSYWRHIISMRTDRYRMAVMVNGTDKQVMLFDHTTDPNETSNLAPAHPEIVAQLMPLLETGNRGFLAN